MVKPYFLLLAFLSIWSNIQAQFRFSGQIPDAGQGTNVYLSLVEDYRKINRVYLDQVIRKTTIDSLGNFEFLGNNLYKENRIYRIHMDACADTAASEHFLGICDDVRSILFLADNTDTLYLPSDFDKQLFCTVNSTNPMSGVFLELEQLKEEMVLDFSQFNSEASRQLNLKTWFAKLQEFGRAKDEPLAELYIYELLSDKRNLTYNYYLSEVSTNPYYQNLLSRLEIRYPHTSFTELYRAEITTDRQLAAFSKPAYTRTQILLYVLLAISILLNLLLFMRWQRSRYRKQKSLKKLTIQEKKIVDHILLDLSNKEIADALFVSVSTVKTHINNLYKKLEVSDRKAIKTLFRK